MRDSVNVISFSLLKKLKEDNFMSKINELQKVKSEIEMKENELEKYEKKLVQLKNQEKKIRKQASLEERKKSKP